MFKYTDIFHTKSSPNRPIEEQHYVESMKIAQQDLNQFHKILKKPTCVFQPDVTSCYTVIYRVRIIRFNEVPIKLKMNIYQQTIIVPLSVYTYLYTYVH